MIKCDVVFPPTNRLEYQFKTKNNLARKGLHLSKKGDTKILKESLWSSCGDTISISLYEQI